MEINKGAYVARIAGATGVGLIVIIYEIAIDYMDMALDGLEKGEAYKEYINKARAAVEQLIDALDMNYELSRTLLPLYIYVNGLMVKTYYNKDAGHLLEARGILSTLRKAWLEAQIMDANAPAVMKNAGKIYAGLTYDNNGDLAEYVEEDIERGYKA